MDYEDIPDIPDPPFKVTGGQSTTVSSGSRVKEERKSPPPLRKKPPLSLWKTSPPLQPPPYGSNRTVTPKVDAVYAVIDKNAKTKARPKSIMPMVKTPPTDRKLSLSNPDLAEPSHLSPPLLSEGYGKLDHTHVSKNVVASTPEEYGKLNFGNTSSAQAPLSVASPEEYGRLDYDRPVNYTGEEYGRLDEVTDVLYNTPEGAYGPQTYSKLNRDATPPRHGETESTLGLSQALAGSSKEDRRHSSFDLYGTLTADELEEQTKHLTRFNRAEESLQISGYEPIGRGDSEIADDAIYSEINDKTNKSIKAPPVGYENATLKPTLAEEASYKTHGETQVWSPLPPSRASTHKHGYVNVNDGRTLRQGNNSSSPVLQTRSRSRSTNSRNVLVAASSRHLEDHIDKKKNSFEEVSPPSPPKRGPSIHGSSSPPRPKKPASPKPKVKPPVAHKPIHHAR